VGTLIGYAAAPLTAEALLPWITSFRKHCPHDRVILLADPVQDYTALEQYGVDLRACNLRSNPYDIPEGPNAYRGCVSVYKDRWKAIADLSLGDHEQVLLTDARDVYFQRNPFTDLLPSKLTIAHESVPWGGDAWNEEQLLRFYPQETLHRLLLRETLCAGVVAGPWRVVRDFAEAVYGECGTASGMKDQAAFNVIARFYPWPLYVPRYRVGWCCHCAQTIAPWAIEAAKTKPRTDEVPGLYLPGPDEPGIVTTQRGIPFAIVHHWPMVPQLAHFGKVAP
jgi:hypothetical protein